ncbi:hypothetical protein GBA52_022608 [Prunus armeniaca]|nr:hypothetical protein GBA52_022608 [Prunus armeniaca]
MEPSNKDHHYHLLAAADSESDESPFSADTQLKSDGKRQPTWPVLATGASDHPPEKLKATQPSLNKYALAGALLASTNSVLLGYGKYFIKNRTEQRRLLIFLPRWLVMKGRLDEAKQVLMRTSETKEEAELRLKEIAKAASSLLITSTPAAGTSLSSNWHGQGVWRELLLRPTRPIRRILIAAIGVNFFMQASGNDAVVYYSPEVFREAGIHNKKHLVGVTILMGIAKTSFVLVSALFLDRFGRRPLLLLGSIGMAISLAALGFGSKFLEFSGDKPDWAIGLCVVAVCSAASFFSIGLGPITWVYSSEIFPMRLRAQGSSLAIGVNRLVSGLVAMTFLSISREITFGGMFFALAGIMVVGTVFFYFFLPETKGKSLEEIGVLFEDQVHEEEEEENHKMLLC